MKERPILFSGPMVRAIREGRKTQTRRIVKPQPFIDPKRGLTWEPRGHAPNKPSYVERNVNWNPISNAMMDFGCPQGQPGDWIWVRETWRTTDSLDHCKPSDLRPGAPVEYRAGGHNVNGFQGEPMTGMGRWRPSIFMSKWMSRIILEIVSVRVEMLQDIGDEDAEAEGINRIAHGRSGYYYSAFRNEPGPDNWCHAVPAYKELWESINGPGSWDQNPWVWVIEFKEAKP